MWVIKRTAEYARRSSRYEKKHPRELAAVLDNLDTFHRTLEKGAIPRQAKFGFLHPETSGVLAIDQKGGGSKLAQTRLYVYPDEARKTLYLLTLGDKRSQDEDIKSCEVFLEHLPELEGEADEREPDVHERHADGP